MANKIGSNVVPTFERPTDVNIIMTIVHPQPLVGLGNLLVLNKVTEPATLAKNAPAAQADTGGEKKQDNVQGTDTGAGKSSTPTSRAFSNTLSNDDLMAGILMRKVDTATGALYREYNNIDAVAVDYSENTSVWKKASSYFAQPSHSDRIAVLDYVEGKLLDSLKDFWFNNWTFAVFTDNTINDDVVLASNIFESNQDHFLVLQSDDLSEFTQFHGQNYTIGLKHTTDEAMDAAFVGAIATKQVGSVTWKFKELKGITPDVMTTQERSGIENSHVIGYLNVGGRPETSEGFSLSGEYIDLLHGEIWVKTNMGNELQRLLQDNDKIPYDNRGISMVSAKANYVLDIAWRQGIIATDDATGKGTYEVVSTPYSQQSLEDKSKRHYGGLSFTYKASNAIHTLTVKGTVQSDTILS